MRLRPGLSLFQGIALLALQSIPAAAGEPIFTEGFESGSNCAWSSATQDVAQPLVLGDFQGTTADGSDAIASSCTLPGGSEKVYSYVVPANGILYVSASPIAPDWDVAIYFRTGCAAATELACVDSIGAGFGEGVQVAVTAGQAVFFFIDGADVGASGLFAARSSLCGDGVITPLEMCDGLDLGGANCETFGFIGGSLACSATCIYDVSNCIS